MGEVKDIDRKEKREEKKNNRIESIGRGRVKKKNDERKGEEDGEWKDNNIEEVEEIGRE